MPPPKNPIVKDKLEVLSPSETLTSVRRLCARQTFPVQCNFFVSDGEFHSVGKRQWIVSFDARIATTSVSMCCNGSWSPDFASRLSEVFQACGQFQDVYHLRTYYVAYEVVPL